jgi:hypothetical protein
MAHALRTSASFRKEILGLLRGAGNVASASDTEADPSAQALQVLPYGDFLKHMAQTRQEPRRTAIRVYSAAAALVLALGALLILPWPKSNEVSERVQQVTNWRLEVADVDPAALIGEQYRSPSQVEPPLLELDPRETTISEFRGILELDSAGLQVVDDLSPFESESEGRTVLTVVTLNGDSAGVLQLPASSTQWSRGLHAWGLTLPSRSLYSVEIESAPVWVTWPRESDSLLCLVLLLTQDDTTTVLSQRVLTR